VLPERNLTVPLDMVDASSSSVLAPTLFSLACSVRLAEKPWRKLLFADLL
jgi:hypothetical protein